MSRTEVRAWGRHLGWIFHLDEQPALTATAETVAPPAQIVHYHLHLPPGTDVSGLKLALPPGDAETREETEMRPFSKETRERVLGSPQAVAAHKAARERLERVSEADRKAGRDWETDEYLDANDAVIETEKHVPPWRR